MQVGSSPHPSIVLIKQVDNVHDMPPCLGHLQAWHGMGLGQGTYLSQIGRSLLQIAIAVSSHTQEQEQQHIVISWSQYYRLRTARDSIVLSYGYQEPAVDVASCS